METFEKSIVIPTQEPLFAESPPQIKYISHKIEELVHTKLTSTPSLSEF